MYIICIGITFCFYAYALTLVLCFLVLYNICLCHLLNKEILFLLPSTKLANSQISQLLMLTNTQDCTCQDQDQDRQKWSQGNQDLARPRLEDNNTAQNPLKLTILKIIYFNRESEQSKLISPTTILCLLMTSWRRRTVTTFYYWDWDEIIQTSSLLL